MTIAVGERIPNVSLKCITQDGFKDVNVNEYFQNKKIVLFSLPGAFTPTCSAKHLPGFIEYESDIKSKGIDEIICMSVNDAFVMQAWEKDQNSKGKVTMLADGNGDLAEALGLSFDGRSFGLGQRSKRFVMIIENCKVIHLALEKPGSFDVSSAESILKVLN
tara:strand:+ start:3858 stop:4343 length:486 start_codon:yes stop_codon:yes gene_type:complete